MPGAGIQPATPCLQVGCSSSHLWPIFCGLVILLLALIRLKLKNQALIINEIVIEANQTLGFVKRNVKTKNQSVKELVYKTFVRHKVEYASTVWSPYTKKNIDQIEMLQRRAARWVTNRYSSYDSVSAMLGNLSWRFLENRRYDSRLAMFYKIQYGLVAVPMPSYFELPKKISRHNLNNPLSFRQVYASADYYRFSFFPMTVVLWNRLPFKR